MNNIIYNSNSALFFVTVLFSVLCFSPKVGFGQQIKAIDSEEFFKDYLHLLENGETLIIDGRTRQMFSTGHLKNAINIDADDPNLVPLLEEHLEEPTIVVYCTTMRRTTKIINTLRGMYEGEILYISDGYRRWQQNGFPVSGVSELGLEQAIDEVLNNNDRLKAANMLIEAARAGVEERDGYFKPYVEANFQYAYLDIVPGFKRERLGNIEHTLFPFVSASQVVYSGGRLQSRKEAAEISLEQERKSYEKHSMDLKLAVHLNYFQLASAINQKNIILQNLEHLDDQEQFTRLMIQAGRMSELEVYRITVERNTLRGILLKKNNDIAALSHELGALMGREDRELFEPSDSLQLPTLDLGYPQLMETALENNPVWQQLELSILQQEAQLKIRQSDRNPRVSAQIWAGYEFGIEQFHPWDNKRYFAGLTASMPIYDGNINNTRIRQAQAQVESSQWTRENFQKSLGAEIDNLYSRLEETFTQVSIQEQSVEQGRQSYRLAMIEYQAGRRSNTDLLDIQQALINSELQLNEAKVNYNLSRAKLLYILGIL